MVDTIKDTGSSFRLCKWYLDCVSDAGQTAIGYSATLSWKTLALSYAGYLKLDRNEKRSQRTSLLRCRQPELSADSITWDPKGIACHGVWRQLSEKGLPSVTLFKTSAGSVEWRCLQPIADVRLQIDQETFAGLGYVERLEMTLAPWQLPIQELHWGRFLSRTDYLIWVQWRGSHPLTLVYMNGEKLEDADIETSGLSWADGRLDLRDHVVLRSGPIVKTALAKIPGVSSMFPESVLSTRECKWRSRGDLFHERKSSTGWVIHEIVRFDAA